MSVFASLLANIPATVWSGIIGALLALSGVLLSNRGNSSRLRSQLQHDAAEKAKERMASLRREVYLHAIDELAKSHSHLVSLPTLEPTTANFSDGLQGFFAAAARIQLVAEPKTVLLVNRLVSQYGELSLELLALLLPAQNARSDIQIIEYQYTQTQAEITRVLRELASLNESAKPNPSILNALQSGVQVQLERCGKLADDRVAAWSRFASANVAYQRSLVGGLRDLAVRQIPVMIELRRDLGLGGESEKLEQEMREQVREQMQRMEERLDALIARLGIGKAGQ